MNNNCINYIGVNKNLPTNIKYFKEELFDIVCENDKNSKEISSIISTSINCRINSIKVVNTSKRTSNEGQRLSGKKLLVELTFSYQIKYTTNTQEKYIYLLKGNFMKIMYVVVPNLVEDIPVEDLIRRKKIDIQPVVEDLYSRPVDKNKIYIRILFLLNINFK